MKASFNAQICMDNESNKKTYSIQFETDDHDLYKLVEKSCQKCVDKSNRYHKMLRRCGHA